MDKSYQFILVKRHLDLVAETSNFVPDAEKANKIYMM